MQSYRKVLKTFEDIKKMEAYSEGGVTLKTSRAIRVKLGEVKRLITEARRELKAMRNSRKTMYAEKMVSGSLFPELILVDGNKDE